MCKRREAFSLAVLIGRGLDLKSNFGKALKVCFPLIFPSFLYSVFRALFQSLPFAPLAQLVEHLTLNQGVPGERFRKLQGQENLEIVRCGAWM